MGGFSNGTGRDQAAFMAARIPSFTHFLSSYDPGMLPVRDLGPLAGSSDVADVIKNLPHATTIVTVVSERGVVMAGDRRATAGNMISKRDVEKVFRADEYSAIGMAGVASVGLEFIRLFGVELEHYEKMEGRTLSLEGKANRLGKMIRDNLMAAMQGLAVIPLFAGYDEEAGAGRIFSYDVAGGPYEEHRFHSIGSGSLFAKSALKKYYSDDMSVTRRGARLRAGAVRRGRRRLRHRRPRPDQADLPGDRHDHRRRLPQAVRRGVGRLRAAGRGRPDDACRTARPPRCGRPASRPGAARTRSE